MSVAVVGILDKAGDIVVARSYNDQHDPRRLLQQFHKLSTDPKQQQRDSGAGDTLEVEGLRFLHQFAAGYWLVVVSPVHCNVYEQLHVLHALTNVLSYEAKYSSERSIRAHASFLMLFAIDELVSADGLVETVPVEQVREALLMRSEIEATAKEEEKRKQRAARGIARERARALAKKRVQGRSSTSGMGGGGGGDGTVLPKEGTRLFATAVGSNAQHAGTPLQSVDSVNPQLLKPTHSATGMTLSTYSSQQPQQKQQQTEQSPSPHLTDIREPAVEVNIDETLFLEFERECTVTSTTVKGFVTVSAKTAEATKGCSASLTAGTSQSLQYQPHPRLVDTAIFNKEKRLVISPELLADHSQPLLRYRSTQLSKDACPFKFTIWPGHPLTSVDLECKLVTGRLERLECVFPLSDLTAPVTLNTTHGSAHIDTSRSSIVWNLNGLELPCAPTLDITVAGGVSPSLSSPAHIYFTVPFSVVGLSVSQVMSLEDRHLPFTITVKTEAEAIFNT